MKLEFTSINERKGAELIIDNVLNAYHKDWWAKDNEDELSVTYVNVPTELIQAAQAHQDYPVKPLFGLQRKMKEALDRVNDEWDIAPDKLGLAKSVIAELESDLTEAKSMIAQIEGQ